MFQFTSLSLGILTLIQPCRAYQKALRLPQGEIYFNISLELTAELPSSSLSPLHLMLKRPRGQWKGSSCIVTRTPKGVGNKVEIELAKAQACRLRQKLVHDRLSQSCILKSPNIGPE